MKYLRREYLWLYPCFTELNIISIEQYNEFSAVSAFLLYVKLSELNQGNGQASFWTVAQTGRWAGGWNGRQTSYPNEATSIYWSKSNAVPKEEPSEKRFAIVSYLMYLMLWNPQMTLHNLKMILSRTLQN